MARGSTRLSAPQTAYVGLGANLGDREANLREAVRRLGTLGMVIAVSSLYETEPVGYLDQPRFLNAAASVETTLTPAEVVRGLLSIERALGRRRAFRNAPRTLDLDLLLFADVLLDTAKVAVPHPRMHERAFVLVPLAEIAPDVVHPGLRQPISELLDASATKSGVRLYAPPGWEITR
jgi:2-amino-4-hydroxy-6-hydroxymethyldihydropteridine diphosphokinase